MSTATTADGSFAAALRSSWHASRVQGWALLPLRLFAASAFLYAGYEKISNPQFLNPHARGYFGHFVPFLAKGSPISGFLLHTVAPHAQLFGGLVAYGEFAVGLGTLLGILFRPAAFFGALLNLTYYLSASWHAHPFYLSPDLVFVFGWVTLLLVGAGGVAFTLDPWLAQGLLARLPRQRQAQTARGLAFVLGVPLAVPARVAQPATASLSPKIGGSTGARNANTGALKNNVVALPKNAVATSAKNAASTTNSSVSAKKLANANVPKARTAASRAATRAGATPSQRG